MLKKKAALALSTILLAATLAVCASSAQAQQMNVQGFAVKGCNEYLQARTTHKEDPWIYWVQGYLSGANMARLDFIMTSAALPPPESMAQSIEKYCRAHPFGTMLNATEALYKDLLATSPMQLPTPSNSQRRRP